jgi:hypothetical protein
LARLWLSDPLQHDSLDKTVPHWIEIQLK